MQHLPAGGDTGSAANSHDKRLSRAGAARRKGFRVITAAPSMLKVLQGSTTQAGKAPSPSRGAGWAVGSHHHCLERSRGSQLVQPNTTGHGDIADKQHAEDKQRGRVVKQGGSCSHPEGTSAHNVQDGQPRHSLGASKGWSCSWGTRCKAGKLWETLRSNTRNSLGEAH